MVKREHPLEPLVHLVDDKGVGARGSHMGRTASVATATALRALGTGKKGDETAQKMLAMFTNPKEHADYLTSSRYLLRRLTYSNLLSVTSALSLLSDVSRLHLAAIGVNSSIRDNLLPAAHTYTPHPNAVFATFVADDESCCGHVLN